MHQNLTSSFKVTDNFLIKNTQIALMVKSHRNVISSRATVTHIHSKLHQFLTSYCTDRDTWTEANTIPVSLRKTCVQVAK